ncbi:MAG: diacylglycerol kinase family protein [Patescibacteria group bacterium]
MHFYLFDSFLTDPKYKKILEEIENRILDLDIGGRILHLTVLRDFETSLNAGLQDKYTTLVIVGDDRTLTKAINILAGQKKPLGIIPVGENLEICRTLGIPEGLEAIDLIANRLIEKIDLGIANKHYFISSVKGEKADFSITCDDQYDIELSTEQKFCICNLTCLEQQISNPHDGLLETIIYSQKKNFFGKIKTKLDSYFQNAKLIIKSRGESAPVIVDNGEVLKTPVNLEVLSGGLSLIVGRERRF